MGGGSPSSHGGGTGTPQTWDGVPPPSRPGMGYPSPVQTWDGVPPIQTWDGVPPHLDLGWGTPPRPGTEYSPRPEMGYPPDLGWGTPPCPDLWWGTPQTRDGVPPRPGTGYPCPPMVNRQTFPSINITFPRTTYAGGKNQVLPYCLSAWVTGLEINGFLSKKRRLINLWNVITCCAERCALYNDYWY